MITIYHVSYEECLKKDPTQQLYVQLTCMPKQEKIIEGLKKGVYKEVAYVDTYDLEEAYEKTNSIDCHWSENTGVKQLGTRNRSTSIGDIAVLENQIYMLSMKGFKPLPADNMQYINTSVEEKTHKRFNI